MIKQNYKKYKVSRERYLKSEKGKEAKKRAYLKYYATHKDKAKESAIKWQKNNPEKYLETRRKAEKKFNSTPRGIWHILKTNSKKRGHEFTVSVEEFTKWYLSFWTRYCVYCGKPEGVKRLEIDRKDNSLGYTLSNIALACEECNGVKGMYLSYEEMKIVGELVMKKRWKI